MIMKKIINLLHAPVKNDSPVSRTPKFCDYPASGTLENNGYPVSRTPEIFSN